jgi:hypothetical protein
MARRRKPTRKASTEKRQKQVPTKPTDHRSAIDGPDEIPTDFKSMPTPRTFEEANWWVLKQSSEWYVRQRGFQQLFENSKQIPGFDQAEASLKRASGEFLRREGYAYVTSGPIDFESYFFFQVGRNPSGALILFAPIIFAAAKRGDIRFFERIPREIRRRARRKKKNTLILHMLTHWLHGFLWLMPSNWGSRYLEHVTRERISEENYQKIRQRLNLVGWEAELEHPLIEGYNPKTGAFTFRPGWTNLVPDLSR